MHAVRIAYFVRDEKPISELEFLPSTGHGCPITGGTPDGKVKYPPVWFGRMFPPRRLEGLSEEQLMEIALCLIELGKCMDDPVKYFKDKKDAPALAAAKQEESDIPAGYTYLGQFITHEITFHKTKDLPLVEPLPKNIRSPSLDLDSIYGAGPNDLQSKELYEAGAYRVRLKVGWTQPPLPPDSSRRSAFDAEFQNDLPRLTRGDRTERGVAIIGDERNDENLPLAQTHVAFLKFHNRVVEDLKSGRYKGVAPPATAELFDAAKAEVVKHFQWIVLNDYLPRIVGKDLVKDVIRKPSDSFNPGSADELFIPLEFSAAAFRIGHSMVRRKYKWNREHEDVALSQLFTNTKLSGNLEGLDRLDSTWVIDWKRFYDFTPFADEYPASEPLKKFNKAGKIDTTFDLHLEQIKGFQHLQPPKENNGGGEKPDEEKPANPLFNGQKALTVRNLLRGLALGLPWAEDVADALKLTEAQRLKPTELRAEPHANLLAALGEKKTPLWFYILREAKVQGDGGRLGHVGGRIVAETLIGLIRHSGYSILRQVEGNDSEWELSDWRPAYPRKPTEPETFEMIDLLRAADVVDPIGEREYRLEHHQP
ncbi:MAG TPA: heme peroxidase family protein [Pyrinomonadaceae bacterium]|nr:heme peroxidase family protein [Pyrinomonadaceae bacterium]